MKSRQFRQSRIHKGFTIVETLVAITVLMVAVAGPLVVASKGLNAALYARDQVIASYLAQESMEVIKNVKDNNIDIDTEGIGWLDRIINSTGGGSCNDANSATQCDAGAIYAPTNIASFEYGCSGSCSIGFDSGSGYVNDGTGDETIFRRRYYVVVPNSMDPCTPLNVSECQVRVEVTWNEGTIPYEVDLDSEIVNNLR